MDCDDFGCHRPTWLANTNWPAIISGSVGYEWCTQGSMLPDGCNSTLLDFFSIPNPAPLADPLVAGPEGGITVATNQSGNIRGFGISSCYDASGVPYVVGSRFRLTGYSSVCQSLRNYENVFDSLTVDDLVSAVSGHLILPSDPDFPLTRPSVPHSTPLDLYEVRARCAWLSQPCADCTCP